MQEPISAPLLDERRGPDVLIGITPVGDPRRRLGLASVTVIGFFWVSGGVYGCEELISAAPPLVVCGFTLGVALAFALPNALMTAELATAFPADGGAVAWVRASFGPTVGLHHAAWVWLTSLLDAAVYPQVIACGRGFVPQPPPSPRSPISAVFLPLPAPSCLCTRSLPRSTSPASSTTIPG
jgi:amino acid transporter